VATSPGASPASGGGGGRDFAAYLDEQLGGTGWKASTSDSKSGFVAQDGVFQGQTKQQAVTLSGGGGPPAPATAASSAPAAPEVKSKTKPAAGAPHPDDDFAAEIADTLPFDDEEE
jgi:hypothetical protein